MCWYKLKEGENLYMAVTLQFSFLFFSFSSLRRSIVCMYNIAVLKQMECFDLFLPMLNYHLVFVKKLKLTDKFFID